MRGVNRLGEAQAFGSSSPCQADHTCLEDSAALFTRALQAFSPLPSSLISGPSLRNCSHNLFQIRGGPGPWRFSTRPRTESFENPSTKQRQRRCSPMQNICMWCISKLWMEAIVPVVKAILPAHSTGISKCKLDWPRTANTLEGKQHESFFYPQGVKLCLCQSVLSLFLLSCLWCNRVSRCLRRTMCLDSHRRPARLTEEWGLSFIYLHLFICAI